MNWSKFSLMCFAIALLAHCASIYAQSPPRPPVFIGENLEFTESNYDLAAAMAEVPFNASLPVAPAITSEAVSTTEAEIVASLAVDGRRTIVAPGSYSLGSISIGGRDKHVVLQEGVTLSVGSFNLNGSRIWIEGGIFTATDRLNVFGGSDIRIEGVSYTNANGSGIQINSSSRVLFLSSAISSFESACFIRTDSGGTYDIVFANSNIQANTTVINGWAMRWSTGVERTVVIDSRLASSQNVPVRYERTQVDGFFARNQIESSVNQSFRTAFDNDTVENLWFVDNAIYVTSGNTGAVAVAPYPTVRNLTATGNTHYGPGTVSNLGFPTGQPTWTTSNNNSVVASNTPPAWEMR